MSAGKEVTLGGQTWTPVPPIEVSAAWDCVTLLPRNPPRACAMALALTWPPDQLGRPRAKYSECEFSPGVFGGRVFDELVARGIHPNEILLHGHRAFAVVLSVVPKQAEVKAAENFTAPVAAKPPESSSLSRGTGGKRRAGSPGSTKTAARPSSPTGT